VGGAEHGRVTPIISRDEMASGEQSEEEKVLLQSSEGETFEVSLRVAKVSRTLSTMLEGWFMHLKSLRLTKRCWDSGVTYFAFHNNTQPLITTPNLS